MHKVNWKLAVNDHPEWLKLFCYPSGIKNRNYLRGSNILTTLEAKGIINRRSAPGALEVRNGNHESQPPEPIPELTETERQELIGNRILAESTKIAAQRLKAFYVQMCFCPRCGTDLHGHFEVAMTVALRRTT